MVAVEAAQPSCESANESAETVRTVAIWTVQSAPPSAVWMMSAPPATQPLLRLVNLMALRWSS